MEDGWTKYFLDGSVECGSDELISKGVASWRKGRLENLVRVELSHEDLLISVDAEPGLCEFWQSDDFTIRPGSGPVRLTRRVQLRPVSLLPSEEALLLVSESPTTLVLGIWRSVPEHFRLGTTHFRALRPEQREKWLTGEISIRDKRATWYFSSSRI